jgi:hypothetical protein
MHLIYHIDDILLSFNNDEYGASLVRALLKRFSGSDEGTVHRYLGIDFYWSSGVCLCQLGRRRSVMATPHPSRPQRASAAAHSSLGRQPCVPHDV